MVKVIQNVAIGIFILSVVILTFLSVLSIWGFLENDVLYKSLSTIGVMAFASLIVIIATRAIDNRHNNSSGGAVPPMGGM